MFISRQLGASLRRFSDKLAIVSGPRQAGKTSLVEHEFKPDLTLNMDVAQDRLRFKKFPEAVIAWYETTIGPFPRSASSGTQIKPLVFIDEIHKVKGWRTLIKGTFDKTAHAVRYIASGSSAFELRRQDKGDSLAGRAIWTHLYPISFREYVESQAPTLPLVAPWTSEGLLTDHVRKMVPHQRKLRTLWTTYAQFGSFPEPLLRADPIFSKQWLADYLTAALDRDLKDLHVGRDVERVYQLFQLLLEGLGSTYSLRSLGETLAVSPNTVKGDILALQQILWGIDLPSILLSKAKQIRKEKKFYPMDFSLTGYQSPLATGAQFESTVACLLMRALSQELFGPIAPLHLGFYRDYAGREVDFVVRDKKNIRLALECKLKARQGAGNLPYFVAEHSPKEAVLVVEEEGIFQVATSGYHTVSIELLAVCL